MGRRTPHRTKRTRATNRSYPEGFTPAHGGYEDLLSFQKARIVFDGTVRFCDRFVDKRSRTRDQMVQAARSGKQNILEASQASGTSKETELKLTNVARASLEELLEDFRDYLRTGDYARWAKNSKEALYIRKLGRKSNRSYESYRTISRPDRPKSSPTSSSASFIKPITCSTSNSGGSSRIFLLKVAFANA